MPIRTNPDINNTFCNTTNLMFASRNGDLKKVRLLISRHGARFIDEKERMSGSTALHRGISSGKPEVVKILLDNKATIDV